MSSEHGTPSGAFVNFIAAVVKAIPRDLTKKKMMAWTGNGQKLAQVLRTALVNGPDQNTTTTEAVDIATYRVIHTQIVGGRTYEWRQPIFTDNEAWVSGDTFLERCNPDGTMIEGEDVDHLWERRSEWDDLLKRCYHVTNERRPERSHFVRYFYRGDHVWYRDWNRLDYRFDHGGLAVCRVV